MVVKTLFDGAKEIIISVSNARTVDYCSNGKIKVLDGPISLSGLNGGLWTEGFIVH